MSMAKDFKRKSFLVMLCAIIAIILFDGNSMLDDLSFHIQRIIALSEEIDIQGLQNYPYAIYNTLLYDKGYGLPLFYSDLFILPIAILVYLGLDALVALKIFLIVCLFATFYIAKISYKKVTQNDEKALIFASLYCMAPYLYTNLLQRQAIGEFMAMMFLPLAWSSIVTVVTQEKNTSKERIKNIVILSISMFCLLNVHLISACLAALFMTIYALYKWFSIEEKPSFFKSYWLDCVCAGVLFFALSASFILPMLEQMAIMELRATSGTGFDITEYTLPWYLLFISNHTIYYISEALVTLGVMNSIPIIKMPGGGVVLPFVIMLIFVLLSKKKEKIEFEKNNRIYMAFSILILFLMFFKPIWFVLKPLLGFIQFPCRLLIFFSLFSSIILVDFFTNDKATENIKKTISCVLLVLCFLISTPIITHNFDFEITSIAPNSGYVGAVDYLPNDIVKKVEEGYYRIPPFDEKHSYKKVGVETTIDLNVGDNGKWIQAPLFFYKGYIAQGIDGSELKVKSDKHGHVSIYIPEDAKFNQIIIKYQRTTIQKISILVTVITWVFILLTLIKIGTKKRNNIQKQDL